MMGIGVVTGWLTACKHVNESDRILEYSDPGTPEPL